MYGIFLEKCKIFEKISLLTGHGLKVGTNEIMRK
jgi:hypothetical protein